MFAACADLAELCQATTPVQTRWEGEMYHGARSATPCPITVTPVSEHLGLVMVGEAAVLRVHPGMVVEAPDRRWYVVDVPGLVAAVAAAPSYDDGVARATAVLADIPALDGVTLAERYGLVPPDVLITDKAPAGGTLEEMWPFMARPSTTERHHDGTHL